MSATPGIAKPSILRFAVRLAKLGVSLFYLAGIRLGRVFQRNRVRGCVVLYYHSVPGEYAGRFGEQMHAAASQFKMVDVTEMNQLPSASDSVAITFDDALTSFAENAVPTLVQKKIPATVFVVTDALGQKPSWGEGYYSSEERVMSVEQLRNLPSLISVGSHTLTHPNLTNLSRESAAREIQYSKERLEGMLRRTIKVFSFPHGAFDSATVQQCKDAGYERVFTTEPTLMTESEEQYLVGRVAADPWDWQLEFRLKTLGAYCWQPYVRAIRNSMRHRIKKQPKK